MSSITLCDRCHVSLCVTGVMYFFVFMLFMPKVFEERDIASLNAVMFLKTEYE